MFDALNNCALAAYFGRKRQEEVEIRIFTLFVPFCVDKQEHIEPSPCDARRLYVFYDPFFTVWECCRAFYTHTHPHIENFTIAAGHSISHDVY